MTAIAESATETPPTNTAVEFAVMRSDLLSVLELCAPAAEKKPTIPILAMALLHVADGKLTVTCTDLEFALRASCPANVSIPGRGTLPVRKFLEWVRALPGPEVHVSWNDAQYGTVHCDGIKARIAGMSPESFPELPEPPKVSVDIPVAVLTQAMNGVAYGISVEESRFTLNGALLELWPDHLKMVATDSHRLPVVEFPLDLNVVATRCLIPKPMLQNAPRVMEGCSTVSLGFDESHLFLSCGLRSLIARKLTGTFPNYERCLPSSHDRAALIERRPLLAMLERSLTFSDPRSRAVNLVFDSGALSASVTFSETGESLEKIRAEYDGPSVKIGFNAWYLIEFLRFVETDRIQFLFDAPDKAGELRPVGGIGDYRYLVMPMRT